MASRIQLSGLSGLLILVALVLAACSREPNAQPSTIGQWSAPMSWPVVGVHAALLPTDKVLLFSYPDEGPGAEAWLWDLDTGAFKEVPIDRDIYCGGHSFLPDGRLLVTGGNDPRSQDPEFFGIKDIFAFDPSSETWTYLGDMQVGRWYPTNVTLPDGRVLVLSGFDERGELTDLVEIYDSALGMRVFPGADRPLDLYPRLHVLPSGMLFHSGPEEVSSIFDPATATWHEVAYSKYGYRNAGSSVLLPLQPPDYRPKVLSLGGDYPATDTAEIIDLEEPDPTWRSTASMVNARRDLDAVLLPDGKVLVVGGTAGVEQAEDGRAEGGHGEAEHEEAGNPVFEAEIFDPVSEEWTPVAGMQRPRGYHSTAVLLPDGRVLAAGSDDEPTAEIYSPPYLFQGPRPQISSAPDAIAYGSTFQVSTPDAQDIARVVLMRPAAVTHSIDMEQRYVGLEFEPGSGLLTVEAMANANLAPPGYYMLFVVSSAGVPSEATFIQLGADA